ncbi:hypothetical protein [Leucothrix arctica]|uniref:Uncharacterized protein n=1 Tax=Leucothrix arctica TaxID=1481894 RepID=A0A317C6N8_9GAMM|nr:hypothetical protein [Leucothrix arctica]PWQ93871.1 hypothetical protein DKT75_19925 [Leucothrix arctica]
MTRYFASEKKNRQSWLGIKNKDADAVHEEAKKLLAEWDFEAMLEKSQRDRLKIERPQNSAYITGVSGIKMKFVRHTKRRESRAKQPKPGRKKIYTSVIYTPYFVVSGSVEGKKYIRKFNIKTLGFDHAWMNAVTYLAETKGIKQFSHLLAKRPSVEQFNLIRSWQNSKGYEIPELRLPDELLAKKEVDIKRNQEELMTRNLRMMS